MTPSRAKRGFTLIELTLVLLVLAIAAHLAVRELSLQRADRLRAAADRQLDAIASAVWDDEKSSTPTGFLADMGRLPAAARLDPDSPETSPLTLSELWQCPDGISTHCARPATEENLASNAPLALRDDDVLVPCGWAGPYLRIPPSATLLTSPRLLDPWGNPVETPDAAGLPRLLDADGAAVSSSGTPVAAVRHYGSDGLDDDERPPERSDQGGATVTFATATARLLLAFEPGTVTEIRCYAPLGDKITGTVKNPLPEDTQALLDNLTPGVRVLKILRSDASPRVYHVTLRPGRDTLLDL